MVEDDPITLAIYARQHNLLKIPGWKRLSHIAQDIAKEKNKIRRMVDQYNISKGKRSKGPVYKFGVQIPRNVKEAFELDAKNGITKWQDATQE